MTEPRDPDDRKTWEALVYAIHAYIADRTPVNWQAVEDAMQRRDAYHRYAIEQQARPELLDVEGLAEAIFTVTTSRGHAEHESDECETCRWFRLLSNEAADDAVAQYARLTSEEAGS